MTSTGIIWNARGSGNDDTIARIHQLSLLHRCLFFGILEPMINSSRLAAICRSVGYQHYATNAEDLPKISLFWKDSIDLTCICTNDQYLTFSGGAG